jgi:hypothetical protein
MLYTEVGSDPSGRVMYVYSVGSPRLAGLSYHPNSDPSMPGSASTPMHV